VLALENRNPTRIEEVFAVAEAVPETVRGLTSAFGWVSPPQLQGTAKDLLAAASESAFRESALQLALRVMDGASAREWLKGLVQYPDRLRGVVIGAGITGDPMYIPWLIKEMEIPALARIAGEAFTLITGVNIAYEDLEGKRPEDSETGPTENPEDEDVAINPGGSTVARSKEDPVLVVHE
jgi:hypothetical protein